MPKSKSEKKKKFLNEETGMYTNQEPFIIDKKVDKKNKKFIELEKDAL